LLRSHAFFLFFFNRHHRYGYEVDHAQISYVPRGGPGRSPITTCEISQVQAWDGVNSACRPVPLGFAAAHPAEARALEFWPCDRVPRRRDSARARRNKGRFGAQTRASPSRRSKHLTEKLLLLPSRSTRLQRFRNWVLGSP